MIWIVRDFYFIFYIFDYEYVPSIDIKSAIDFSDMHGKQKKVSLTREYPVVINGSVSDTTISKYVFMILTL